MQIGQIAHAVSDADRAQAFYGDRLGLPLMYRHGDLVFFDCDGVRLMLEGGAKDIAAGGCIYFKTSGIEAHCADLRAKGVAFEGDPHLIARMPDHELWMAFFRDPDGHLPALMEEKR